MAAAHLVRLVQTHFAQKLKAQQKQTEADKTTVKAMLDTFILKNRFQQLASTHKEQTA